LHHYAKLSAAKKRIDARHWVGSDHIWVLLYS